MDEKDLKKMTATKLRELAAKNYPSIHGVTGMKKDELISALLEGMKENVEITVEKKIEGEEDFLKKKKTLKQQVKEMKEQRDKAIKGKDQKLLKQSRYKLKKLRRALRRLNLQYQKMLTKGA